MVNVYTNNGQFNITESLMEAIKVNNPELLVEKNNEETNGLTANQKRHYRNISDYEAAKERFEKNKAAKKAKEDAQNQYDYKPGDTLFKDKSDSELEKSDKAIIFDQILRHNDKISYPIEIDNRKYTRSDINNILKDDEEFRSAYEEIQKIKNGNDEEAKKALSVNSGLDSPTIDYVRGDNDNDNFQSFYNFIKSPILAREINTVESLAHKLIQRCETCVKDTLGLTSSIVNPITTTDNDDLNNDLNNTLNHSDNTYYNNDILKMPNKLKNTKGDFKSISVGDETLFNNNDNKNKNKNIKMKNLNGGVKNDSRFGGVASLLTNGVRFSSLFKYGDDINDERHLGTAIKYYASALSNGKGLPNNNKSMIDDLFKYFLDYRRDKSKFMQYIGGKEDTIDDSLIKNEFANLVYNLLHNVVWKVQIADDSMFDSVMRAIKFDKKMAENFDINNMSELQMFNAKEQTLIFRHRGTQAIALILVGMPLLARGKEILKKLKGFGNTSLKNMES